MYVDRRQKSPRTLHLFDGCFIGRAVGERDRLNVTQLPLTEIAEGIGGCCGECQRTVDAYGEGIAKILNEAVATIGDAFAQLTHQIGNASELLHGAERQGPKLTVVK